jgi:hypothetical protein
MPMFKKLFQRSNPEPEKKEYPIIPVTLQQVKQAVYKFSKTLPKGVHVRILIKEDHSIDFEQLAPLLHGIPNRPFYMSRETYEVFEEADKHIPKYMDAVQEAVDLYIKNEKELPIIPHDPYNKISYYLLEKKGCLATRPPMDFYLTGQENMVSHLKQ